jgi:DNA-binding LytR/AlgR family response regulator
MNPTPLRCLIADDEDLAVALLENYIQKMPQLELIKSFENALQVESFLLTETVDLLFLDIQMPYLTGFQLLEKMQSKPAVIITTSYSDFALEGFRLNVTDYLLKPFLFERFEQAVQKAIDYRHLRKNLPKKEEHIFIRAEQKMIKVNVDDILYVEGLKQYIKIFTAQKMYVTLESMKNIQEMLPPDRFVRIHKSFIISLDKIQSYSLRTVEINHKKIPVGRSYSNQIAFIQKQLSSQRL